MTGVGAVSYLERCEERLVLQRARRAVGMSLVSVAVELGWPLIRVVRSEQGITSVPAGDVAVLKALYEACQGRDSSRA